MGGERKYLANGLILFLLWVVAGEKVASVVPSPSTLPEEPSNDNEVKGIPATLQVVLLQFQPLLGTLGQFIARVHIQCLDHQALTISY